MRVYFKGVALGFALLLMVLLLQKHFRSQGNALGTVGKRGRSRQVEGDGKMALPKGRAAPAGGHRETSSAARSPSRTAKARVDREDSDTATGLDPEDVEEQDRRKKGNSTHTRSTLQDRTSLSERQVPVSPPPSLSKNATIAMGVHDKLETTPRESETPAGSETTAAQSEAYDYEDELGDDGQPDPKLKTLSREEKRLLRKQQIKPQRFGLAPKRPRPKPPEKVKNESEPWLKDMEFPKWYTDSVKRSKVYGKENDFVGGGPLFPGPCPGAEEVKQRYKKENIQTFSYIEHGELIPNSKNPCWYEDSKHKRLMRCLPYFYVAGVAKCGTTDLYKRIRYHPEIMEGELKEYHWWDRLRYGAPMELKFTKDSEKNEKPLPLSEYSRIITGKEIEDLKLDLRTLGKSYRVCGDGSPSYLWDGSQWTIYEGNEGCTEPRIITGSFIKHAYPPSKILLIFRHPTPRLYSRFLSRIDRYPPFRDATPQMFHDFVVKGVACYKKCFKEHSIRECAYNETLYDEAVVRIVEGLYSVFMEDWLRIFRRDQMMIMRNEDYSDDVEGHMIDIFSFLNVSALRLGHMKHIVIHWTINVGQYYDKVGPMLPETIEILNEFYKPFVLRLHQLLGDDRFLWKDIDVK